MKLQTIKNKIGAQIKVARRAKKWSQLTLATATGTTKETIRNIENGNANCTVEKLANIETALQINIFICTKKEIKKK